MNLIVYMQINLVFYQTDDKKKTTEISQILSTFQRQKTWAFVK